VTFDTQRSTESWDDIRVHDVFEEEVAAKVLQIPISRHGGDNFLCWPHNKFGIYTVRSAYHLARTEAALVARSAA
jgi:hypothetical protein